MLQSQIQLAEESYERAANFVGTRRGGVGPQARTRLMESQRHIEQARALAPTDPEAAIGEARRARHLAESAYELAAQDFNSRFGGGGPFGGGGAGPVVIPFPTGGWSGGGWGGSPWGSFGAGGGDGGGAIGGGWGGGSGGGAVGGHW
jgi:hypothetical protein